MMERKPVRSAAVVVSLVSIALSIVTVVRTHKVVWLGLSAAALSAQTTTGDDIKRGETDAISTVMLTNDSVTRDKVEAKLRTRQACFYIYAKGGTIEATDDLTPGWPVLTYPVTITKIECETNTGTVTANIQNDDGTPVDIGDSDLVCAATPVTRTTFTSGEDALADGDKVILDVVSVASSPVQLSMCWEYTVD